MYVRFKVKYTGIKRVFEPIYPIKSIEDGKRIIDEQYLHPKVPELRQNGKVRNCRVYDIEYGYDKSFTKLINSTEYGILIH